VAANRLTVIVLTVIITVMTAACSSSLGTASNRSEILEEPSTDKMERPNLSDSLLRNCQLGQRPSSVRTGKTAVDFTLKDTRGLEYTLSALLIEKPVVMVFGSYT